MSRSSGATRGWVRFVVAAVIGLLLVAVALFVVVPRACGSVFAGAPTATGECLGLVDDPSVLAPEFQAVAQKILDENAEVAASPGISVKIVLLTPLSLAKNSGSAMSVSQVRASMEGAFTAQYRANHSADFGDPTAVKIEMVLINQGSRQDFSQELVDEVLGQGDAEHPVVAVVGLGSSFVGTDRTARAFAERGVPMVTAVASASTLDMRQIKGLHSVSPSNVDYIQALKELLTRHKDTLPLDSAIVVADQNNDLYTSTLNDAFTSIMSEYIHYTALPFRGGTVDHPATSDVFDPVVTNICNAVSDRSAPPLNTIMFAGRVADFRVFAEVLAGRTCRQSPLAVLVGATGFSSAREYVDVLDRGNVTVIFTSSADAPAWINGRDDEPEGFPAFLAEFRERGFSDDLLDDGYGIMYHDAMACAVRATRLAAQGSATPSPADVDVQFGNLTRAYVVRGASGTLSFGGRPDGRASGKQVVYRQVGLSTPYLLPANLAPYAT